MYICDYIFLNSFYNENRFSQKLQGESKHAHGVQNLFPENGAILRDNVEKYYRSRQSTYDNKIRRMRFACWIPVATNTHSEYVILIAFPLQ